jgi:hypothetical protein
MSDTSKRVLVRALMMGFKGRLQTKSVSVTRDTEFLVEATVLSSNMGVHPLGQLVYFSFPLRGDAVSTHRVFTWLVAVCGVSRDDKEERVAAVKESASRRLNAAVAAPLDNEFVGVSFRVSLSGKPIRNRIFLDYRFDADVEEGNAE